MLKGSFPTKSNRPDNYGRKKPLLSHGRGIRKERVLIIGKFYRN